MLLTYVAPKQGKDAFVFLFVIGSNYPECQQGIQILRAADVGVGAVDAYGAVCRHVIKLYDML